MLEPQASRLTALLWYDHVPVDGCSRVFGGTEYNRQAGHPWSQRKRSNFMVVPWFEFSLCWLCVLCVFLETHCTRSADLCFLRLGRFPVRKAFGFPVCSFKAAAHFVSLVSFTYRLILNKQVYSVEI